MFYKVTNYFGGVCEYYATRELAKARFDELVADGSSDVELMRYIKTDNGGYAGSTLYLFWKDKVYAK